MKVACIVEGHGEVEAVPVLLRRLASILHPDRYVEIVQPIRIPKSKLVKDGELERAVRLASLKATAEGAVFIVIDADEDCPGELGKGLRKRAAVHHPQDRIGVVLAKREFEAWYIAAAKSIRGERGLSATLDPPSDPESVRDAKGWLSRSMQGSRKYSETVDQPALAAIFDLEAAEACRSFRKLRSDFQRVTGSM